jgi:stage II sporulation protein D
MKYIKIIGIIISSFLFLSACTVTKDISKQNKIENNNIIKENNIDTENNNEINQDKQNEENEPELKRDDVIITRAIAAKMISLANFDKRTIELSDREIEFDDTSPDNWFDKYINIVVVNKWMLGSNKEFKPLRPLTNKELDIISKRFEINLNELNIFINQENNNEPAEYKDFMNFYKLLCDNNKDDLGIKTKRLIVFATPANSSSLSAWKMATNYGIYSFEGLTLDCYLDNEIEVIIRGNEIIALKGVINEIPKLTNAYIEKIKSNIATVFMGGISRDLTINHDEYKDKNNVIGDIVIDKGHITAIQLKEDKINDKVLLIGQDKVSLKKLGTYSLANDVKVYSKVDNIKWKSINNVVVGYDSSDFIVDNKGKVCAVIIKDKVDIENIRVLISTTKFQSKYHKDVEITCTTDYLVEYGDAKKQFKAQEIVNIDKNFFSDVDRVFIRPNNNGKVTINSIEKGSINSPFHPSYRGIIEISKEIDGYLIVNEVAMEEYLYAVVPSEMPTSYGLEALKTQAVCARSYAYTQFYSNRFCKYGAHVIDSVSSQVYNNTPENEASINAVNETSRQGLTFNGRVVSTKFFSTSCGFTANSGDVWAEYSTKQFPTNSPKYLEAKPQFKENTKYKDLSDEKLFREFILDNDIDSYDKKFGYYRWSVELSREHIEASINSNIKERYNIQPKLIKTLDKDIFRSRPIESIGKLKDIGIYKRGKGGNITEMIIEGSEGVVKVSTEYNIRLLISPISYITGAKSIPVKLQNDKEVNVFKLMPSAFYIMDKEYDKEGNLVKILFRGGGYGHGVGMSQNGVKGMVNKGYHFNEILNHYYTGTKVEKIY